MTPPAWSEIARLAEPLVDVLDAVEIARVDLLRSSLLGYLAQVFAIEHAKRIDSLLLASTFFDAGDIQQSLPSPEQLAKMAPVPVASKLSKWLVPPHLRSEDSNDVKTVLGTMVGTSQPLATLKSRATALALTCPVDRVPLPPESTLLILGGLPRCSRPTQ